MFLFYLPRAYTRTLVLAALVVLGSLLGSGLGTTRAWSSSSAPADPAKLQVLRAGVKDGRLDVLAAMTKRADGDRVHVGFIANGVRSKFTVRVQDGRIRFKRRLPVRQRRASTGIMEIRYAGNDRVRPADVRLRAATGKAKLQRDLISLHENVLRVRGSLTGRARGVVRLILSYVRPSGTVGEWQGRAPVDREGSWSLRKTLPPDAAAGGYMSIQFTGSYPRVRGEQIAKQLLDGESFGPGAPNSEAAPATQPVTALQGEPVSGTQTPDGQPAEAPPQLAPTPTSPTARMTWAPVGTRPLSDAQASALITRRLEIRVGNAAANSYVPTDPELSSFQAAKDSSGRTPAQYNPLMAHVTGRPGLLAPSTDDLIQWTAQKWGIPEDLIRAQMVQESWWKQAALGDRRTVADPSQYPLQARITGTSDVYESMGVMQIKWRPDGSRAAGTESLRWKSTAFHLDYYGAGIRYYYDGLCSWCGTGYSAGQEWPSIGAWFQPLPWGNADAQSYIQKVKNHLTNRSWANSGF